MLSDIAAEVLHFLTRRDLDKAAGVSKWLDALIAQCCEVYPLRPVHKMELYRRGEYFMPTVCVNVEGPSGTSHSFSTMTEAAHFAGYILRKSRVVHLVVGNLT